MYLRFEQLPSWPYFFLFCGPVGHVCVLKRTLSLMRRVNAGHRQIPVLSSSNLFYVFKYFLGLSSFVCAFGVFLRACINCKETFA